MRDRTENTPSMLEGIRVLDLSRVLAGPWATQLLADLGAEVIKVEQPGRGDDTRRWGPPFVEAEGEDQAALATYYLCANRGKKSITIDIRSAQGRELVIELARQSDVFIENFKVGGLKAYGLDYESVRTVAPNIIYCSITGFGQTGELRSLPGYDLVVQAMGGLMSVTGPAEGEPGSAPTRSGVAVADLFTGMYAANAIQAALINRQTTGKGAYIDMALLDTQVAMLANLSTAALATGRSPRRTGNAHSTIAPYQPFVAADGEIVVAVGNDTQFARFCEILGLSELAADEKFSTNAVRVQNRDLLIPKIAAVMLTRTRAEWTDALRTQGVPCGPIQDIVEALNDPQVRERGMVQKVDRPGFGPLSLVSCPIRYNDSATTNLLPPPFLGEHTDEVLQEILNLDTMKCAALKAAHIV
jgi:crotonobetainyl-CoA:carnitine CoA-transferase CaiB-like acyl-CoA transferase